MSAPPMGAGSRSHTPAAPPSITSSVTPAAVDDASRHLVAIFESTRERAKLRLSSSQLQALLVIADDEGLTIGALAERMSMMVSSASRLCDRLTAAGMIERFPGPVDRREVCLSVTGAGADLLDRLTDDRRRHIGAVLERMAPAARAALLRGLREFSRAAAASARAERTA